MSGVSGVDTQVLGLYIQLDTRINEAQGIYTKLALRDNSNTNIYNSPITSPVFTAKDIPTPLAVYTVRNENIMILDNITKVDKQIGISLADKVLLGT
jgi:hypothetical protein